MDKTGYVSGHRSVDVGWPGGNIHRIGLENEFEVAVGCGMAVVPVRQFCETLPLGNGQTSRTFCSLKHKPSQKRQNESALTCTTATAYPKSISLPRININGDVPDMQYLLGKIQPAYMKRSLVDEANVLFGDVLAESWQGVGKNEQKWVNGNTGSSTNFDMVPPASGDFNLTCSGLLSARDVIVSHGYESGLMVCYTTRKGLDSLKVDCASMSNYNKWLRQFPVDGVAIVDGILVVANLDPASHVAGHDQTASHSIMFVNNVSFGMVSDDMVTIGAGSKTDTTPVFYGTHNVGGVVKNVDSICHICHT